MKKGGGSESTIIVGPSKSVLVYALYSLEYVLGLARFRMFEPKLYIIFLSFKNDDMKSNLSNFDAYRTNVAEVRAERSFCRSSNIKIAKQSFRTVDKYLKYL